MIVPRDDPGKKTVSFAEIGVRAIESIPVAIALQRSWLFGRDASGTIAAAAFIDVVSKEKNNIDIFTGHRFISGVVTGLKLLALSETL